MYIETCLHVCVWYALHHVLLSARINFFSRFTKLSIKVLAKFPTIVVWIDRTHSEVKQLFSGLAIVLREGDIVAVLIAAVASEVVT